MSLHWRDNLHLAGESLRAQRTRTLLTLLAMAIGVASVVLLTGLAEGARHYVQQQFSSLGSHLIIVVPGRNETTGGPPPLLGTTPQPLTLDDALALRRVRAIRRVAPAIIGSIPVRHGGLEREVTVIGSTPELLEVRNLSLASGRFLPAGDPHRARPVVVLGARLKEELFGNRNPLGAWLRIQDRRYRVIGVLAEGGQSLGIDLGDMAVIPVASAQQLFNTESLFRILIQANGEDAIEPAKQAITRIIRERHNGKDDITIVTQDAILAAFGRIFTALSLAVGGVAAISLLVAGILTMNVMLVSVTQRTAEIGLLKALGATNAEVQRLILGESGLLSLSGAVAGLLVALVVILLERRLFPSFPLAIPAWAVAFA
ncbi:MAG: ABC transporter permease, partial [Gammaproteobacteria bacterium]